MGDPHPVATGTSYVSPRIAKYVEDPEFEHEDFAKRGDFSGVSTFRVQVKKKRVGFFFFATVICSSL